MFAWIQQLLGIECVETAEEATSKLRRRMLREAEGLLNYELKLSGGRLNAASWARLGATRENSRQMDGAGQA